MTMMRLRLPTPATAALLAALVSGPAACGMAALHMLAPSSAHAATAAVSSDGEDASSELRSLLGSYLAGRFARAAHDTVSAAGFYKRALEQDPGNETLLKQAFVSETTAGNWTRASALADELITYDGNNRLARLFLGVREFRAGAFEKADEHFKAASSGPIGELTGALARAWVRAAQGNEKGATELLDTLQSQEWAQPFQNYHRALIADVIGNRATARQAYEKLFDADFRSLRPALAYASHAAFFDQPDLARKVLAKNIDANAPGNPLAHALLEQIDGKTKPPLLIETSVHGLAEIFYGLGEVLASEGGLDIGTVYLQLSLHLRPDAPLALAALANVYEATKQNTLAIETYNRIPANSPLSQNIEIRKALNLNILDKVDEAKSLLESIALKNPKDIKALDALGNIMRARKRFEEATSYYTKAIQIIEKPAKSNWSQYYSRGVSLERLKNWSAAEADLIKALELSPDQPLILNYLGYSWVDQSKNLKQAMGYIAKAVKLKPDDGYFVDSLGWAHYRLGDFKQAALFLERAVELRPEDPTINDHLGDALWRVGRTVEARYQWEQALSLKPEPEDVDRITHKVVAGLPVAKAEAPAPQKKRKEVRRVESRQKRADKPSGQPIQ